MKKQVKMKAWKIGFVSLWVAFTVTAAQNPNIIVIYTDDQGFGDASCLNENAKFKTPNLDRLAKEGRPSGSHLNCQLKPVAN